MKPKTVVVGLLFANDLSDIVKVVIRRPHWQTWCKTHAPDLLEAVTASLHKNKYEKKYQENIDDYINILKYIVENHHPATKKIAEEFNISMVKEADHLARQKELSHLMKLK